MSIEAEKGMCRHDARAVCWMCSDQQAWWRDARIKAGYGAEPPNGIAPVVVAPARRRLRVMWRKWTRDSRSRRRAGAA